MSKPAQYPCQHCGAPTVCRSGWREVPEQASWKRRTRTCSSCGKSANYIELPQRDLKPHITGAEQKREAKALVQEAKGLIKKAQGLIQSA